jgi:hypothetical protein
MTRRRITFVHDGHSFEALEQATGTGGSGNPAGTAVRWDVRMDGTPALEFSGEFPYRDSDVMKRVVEWYEIQKRRD